MKLHSIKRIDESEDLVQVPGYGKLRADQIKSQAEKLLPEIKTLLQAEQVDFEKVANKTDLLDTFIKTLEKHYKRMH